MDKIQKDSGLITLDFTGNPELLVDCGKLFYPARDEEDRDFPVAQGTDVKGKMNITLHENEDRGTVVRVSARYFIPASETGL